MHKCGSLGDVKDASDGMKFAWDVLDDEQVEVNYYDPNPDTCMFGEQVELANFGEKVALVNE
eukprot:2067744-Ditylum_brightwellii.AAC.1